jgi:hypothetical protein
VLGVVVLGGSLDKGKSLNSCKAADYGGVSPKVEASKLGMQLQASAGLKASFGGGGSATGGCTC